METIPRPEKSIEPELQRIPSLDTPVCALFRVHQGMKRLAVLTGLFSLLAFAPGTTELAIYRNDNRVGSAWITTRLIEEKGLSIRMRVELDAGERTITVIEESDYDAEGRPVRKYARMSPPGEWSMIIATFKNGVATVITEQSAKRHTTRYKAPESADTRAVSEFWFIKTKPKPEETATYHRFDISKMRWLKTVVKYEGLEEITIGGKKISAHLTTLESEGEKFKTWTDDKGAPLKVEAGTLVMVRE